MRNYRRFWVKPKEKKLDLSNFDLEEPQLMNDIFKVQDFLLDLGMTKIGSFGFKFTAVDNSVSRNQRHFNNVGVIIHHLKTIKVKVCAKIVTQIKESARKVKIWSM